MASVPRTLLQGDKLKVPHSSAPHGQELFWGKSELSLQGVTELTQPVRCKDPWYNNFLEQCRHKELSEINFKFMSGGPTPVPGSWVDGVVTCHRKKCEELTGKWQRDIASGRSFEDCNHDECRECRKARLDRKRVVEEGENVR